MLKKMRQRVILAAMLSFFAVIMMIAALVNIVDYIVVTGRADRTLSAISVFEEGRDVPGSISDSGEAGKPPAAPPDGPFMGLPDVEENYMTRFFVVRFDKNEEVVYSSIDYIASVDETDAASFARQVLKKKKDRGYFGDYRYVKNRFGDNVSVIFLNTSREQQSMRILLVLTGSISFISLIIVFVLVELLAGRAIRPIANNIRQQKQFITDAGHELKTPLTSISTSVDVICMEHGDDEWTDNIRKQTGRMSRLVKELVTLSRLDEDMPLPDKEQLCLSDEAWEIADVYMPQAKAAGKKMTVDIEENIEMTGVKDAIRQMLSVLLDNAVKYSEPGGEIGFSVYKKKGKTCIDVFNTCHYDEIPDTERLFDRFYRPDSSRNSETGGSGVGLSIARAVALAHGGTIKADCPSGSTMTIKVRV